MKDLKDVIFATSTNDIATLNNEDNLLIEYDFNDKYNADNRIQLWDDRKGKDGKTRYFLFVGRDVTGLFDFAKKVKKNAEKGIFSANVVSNGREIKIVGTPERVTAILQWLSRCDMLYNVEWHICESEREFRKTVAKNTTKTGKTA
jgi:hypothetical protein